MTQQSTGEAAVGHAVSEVRDEPVSGGLAPSHDEPPQSADLMVPAEAASTNPPSKPAGLVCPKCSASNWMVWKTRHCVGRVKRIRVCYGCGHRVMTVEKPILQP